MKTSYSVILMSILILTMSACSEGDDSGGNTNNISTTTDTINTTPIANAGIDQNIHTGTLTSLDGSASSDADGDALTYSWSFKNKPTTSGTTIDKIDSVKPSFITDVDGTYTLSLIVNDGTIDSKVDEVTIISTTTNAAPVAQAGQDQTVHETDIVTLHGLGSDADGDTLTYQWSVISVPQGSNATLSNPNIINPTFNADVEGKYNFSLVVNDGRTNSNSDEVFINAYSSKFITTWKTEADKKITIIVNGIVGAYLVDWGDGQSEYYNNNATHIYNVSGTYTIKISGDFNNITFLNAPSEAAKLLSVDNWGIIKWTTMESAFDECSNLVINAEDKPDLSHTSNMSSMFRNAKVMNNSIGDWNTSTITNMDKVFQGAISFNQPLKDWDTHNVTTMVAMFHDAKAFNQPLNDWNTSNVLIMSSMFSYAISFKQPLDKWDTSNVTNMHSMFSSATSFNQPLEKWDTSNVTNMSSMFGSAVAYNQPLNDLNVSNTQYMTYMFRNAIAFNQALDDWNTSRVINMEAMFQYASSFNQSLGDWNTTNVTDMEAMFDGATIFNQPINKWDTSNVTIFKSMFQEASSFNQPLGNWNTSSATIFKSMFQEASSFNQPLGDWNTSSATDMEAMFKGATTFNQPVGNWDVSHVQNMHEIFTDATLNISNYHDLLTKWGVQDLWYIPLISGGIGLEFNAPNCHYYAGGTAENNRTHIIDSHYWTISDGGTVTPVAPEAPININISTDRFNTHLSWTDMSDNETSFILEMKLDKDLVWSAPQSYPIDTEHVLLNGNAASGQTVQFRIKAYNDVSGSSTYLNGSHTY